MTARSLHRFRLRPVRSPRSSWRRRCVMSSIVFSEPAVADVLMLAVIFALPLLGVMTPGRNAFTGSHRAGS